MRLSIIIVNYNVKYFLEQCLISVKRALEGIDAEVIVIDNASADHSVDLIREKFAWVKAIFNTENVGYSRANNQGMKMATGEYVLLLNPDTVVAEDTFQKCLSFMDAHAEAGALGVRMIDGKGNFLPESKRGLPTPAVAFYKTFGLAKLFPRSKTFGQYHLGFLPENETHEVDILSGAFMFIRKKVLDEVGLLDEAFFMYGEDVDMSYRITKAGYRNYYFPDCSIIHYKGESTKKGSLNYVKVFYKAMIIFARKHFSGSSSGVFSLFINVAIILRGLLTLVAGMVASSYLFVIDALLSFAGIFLLTEYWQTMIKYSEHYYPQRFFFIVVPLYIFIWIVSTLFSGGYDKPFRIIHILRGILAGTIAIAVVYAFLPNDWRFSRAIILLGGAWTGFEMLLTRALYHLIRYQSLSVENDEETRSLIAGGAEESTRAESILRSLGNNGEIITDHNYSTLAKTAAIHSVNQLVFCSGDLNFGDIMQQIKICGNEVDYRILNQGSDALIGSNSKNTSGDLYVAERSYPLFKPVNVRRKRVLDLLACIILIPLLPFSVFLIKNFGKYISNWWAVLSGDRSWIGFSTAENLKDLPSAKAGVIHPSARLKGFEFTGRELVEIELNYAKHYSAADDVSLLLKNYRNLGQ